MGKKNELYRLPNGQYVHDLDEYLESWRILAKPIEEISGLKHCSFDPQIGFMDPKNSGCHIQLPVWFIERVREYLLNKFGPSIFDIKVTLPSENKKVKGGKKK